MDNSSNQALRAAVYGTLVADAASMGLHWIYSQGKIASIAKKHDGKPEFLEPDEENYKGVPSFFAHPLRTAGDGSSYSSYAYVLFKSVNSEPLGFSLGKYIRTFQEYYGIGGQYVGYADTPMRETMYNITTASKSLKEQVDKTVSPLPDDKKNTVGGYIARYFFEHDREELKKTVKNALRLHEFSRDEMAAADDLVDAVAQNNMKTGADDDQMPGLSQVALFAHLYQGTELKDRLEAVVRVTNNNDLCVSYALFMARVLHDLYGIYGDNAQKQKHLKESILAWIGILPDTSQKLIHQAMDYNGLDYRNTTKTFGAACHVDMAIPLSIHILLNTNSFEEVVRVNILASGDNCGRAIFLGALAGAMYGVEVEGGIPDTWLKKTHLVPTIKSFLDSGLY